MNNDLEQFSEERLKELDGFGLNARLDLKPSEGLALIRIALAAKQAKPVGYLFVSPDGEIAYSISNVEFEGVKLVGPIYSTPQPAHTEQDDTRRMNWLVSQHVEVRTPMVYGSHARFVAQCDSDDCEEYHTTLREQIDKAMLAAAPKPESE